MTMVTSDRRELRPAILCFALAIGACADDPTGSSDPSQTLNAGVKLPNEGDALDNPPIDESITVTSTDPTGGGGPSVTRPGDILEVALRFEAPNGNVVGAGIRFGEDGPVRVVDIPDAMGVTEGTLEFQVEVPASVCDDIAQICHDVRCYEFAVTDAGAVSKANINDIGLVCGGCDVPSCQDLLDCGSAETGAETGNASADTSPPPEPECTVSSECGTKPGTSGQLVCKDGECVFCQEDADCEAGSLCVASACYPENCDWIPVVPAEQLNQLCTCPEGMLYCLDAPECAGMCFGGVCAQDCHATADENLCTSICGGTSYCWPNADSDQDFCSG